MAKVKKGVLTQGTQVWIKHGLTAAQEITKMVCITGITLGDDSPTDIDNTCLEEMDSKTSLYGLNQPGEGSIMLNTDPEKLSHITLLELAADLEGVEVYVGWSDGIGEPKLDAPLTGKVELPTTRTWTSFTALLKDSSPTFDADSLVKHTISMKRQSKAITTYKTTP